jgi:ferric-dicitrate binding protein FerR (iron transport regulator)
LLKFPKEFEDDYREVFLIGEGYFEVTPDRLTPFIVQTNEAKITVVGTQFNVRAWEKSNKLVVAVTEGKVLLQTEKSTGKENEVVISKGQISMLDENGIPSPPVNTDVDRYVSWLNREFYFQSTPLIEILDQLERWYDVEFILPDDSYSENTVTVFIENKPIDDNLNVISLIMNFNYEKSGNKIIFSPAD